MVHPMLSDRCLSVCPVLCCPVCPICQCHYCFIDYVFTVSFYWNKRMYVCMSWRLLRTDGELSSNGTADGEQTKISRSAHLGPARDHDPHYRPLDHLTWRGVRLARGKLGARLMARITSRYDRSTARCRGRVQLVSLTVAGCAGPSYRRPFELSNFRNIVCVQFDA